MAALRNIFLFGFFISFIAQGYGIIRGDCPIGCDCDSMNNTVECFNKNWNELPPLPKETREVHIKDGNIGKLKKPKACHTYVDLTLLDIRNNHITDLAADVFLCMPKLRSLTMIEELLQNIPTNVFRHTSMIENIVLKLKNSSQFHTSQLISILCKTRSLKKLVLKHGLLNIKQNSLECLNLLNLSHVDLSCGHSGDFTHHLQSFKHVSKYLALRMCRIAPLTDDIFMGFQVEALQLYNSYIRPISNNAFVNMKHLKALYLDWTNISETHGWLKNLSIEVIQFRDNFLTKIPHLGDVREMDISGNSFVLTNGSVSGLLELEILDLRASNISQIEQNAFCNLPKLEELYISYNIINGRNFRNLLSNLVHCPLKTLDLSHNKLYYLNGTFEMFQMKQLEFLYLDACDIVYIQPYTFQPLKNLRTLHLSENKMMKLGLNAFSGMKNLTCLHLDENSMEEFKASYVGLQSTSLTALYLKHNNVQKFSIENISTLMKIDLSGNSGSLFIGSFNTLISLDELIIKSFKNSAPTIYGHLRSLPNLSNLDISGADIYGAGDFLLEKGIKPGYFLPTPNLEKLDISKCTLKNLHASQQKELFGILIRLKQLRLNDCQISVLIPGMFATLHKLEELELSSNHIYSATSSAFWNLSNLRSLNLNNNYITHVGWESLTNLPNLRYLSLAGNALLCTCEVIWLYQAIKTNDLVFIRDAAEHRCLFPQDVENVPLPQLNFKVSDCEDNWLQSLKHVGYGLVIIITVLLIYVTWRYRWHIRYTLFLARAGQGRYEEFHDAHEYIYDAFVAYSSEDLPWVKNQLLCNVDMDYLGPAGLKLCLHHRDWLVGVDIVENIVKSIAESRRTILVLSKDFAVSRWCQFELAMAHLKLDAEGHKKGRLLVILLNDIPPELLSPRLVYLLSSKTYLKWLDDPDSQRIFWKTLHKSLKKKLFYDEKV